jgi:HK97 family phage prohead protease
LGQTQNLKDAGRARSHLEAHSAEIERASTAKVIPKGPVIATFPTALARQGAQGRTMVGYAAAWDVPIEDAGGWFPTDRMYLRRASFDKTLKEHGDEVKVLFNHGKDPQIGMKPLGKPQTMRRDDYGLWTETPLDKTSYNDDIIVSLESGALDAMSVTMEVKDYEYLDDDEALEVTQARLYEYGPVTFAANPGATASVHSVQAFDALHSSPERAEDSEDGGRPDPPPTLATLTWRRQALPVLAEERRFSDELKARTLELARRVERDG